jgi:hypothetical protein
VAVVLSIQDPQVCKFSETGREWTAASRATKVSAIENVVVLM